MSADAKEMDYSHHEGDVPKSQHNESHETLRRVYNTWTGTYRAPELLLIAYIDLWVYLLASAYQVLMMASWTCNVVLYSTVFDVGGPMMLIYSTIIVTFGQCLMMSSLAELCSEWPYAGGQHIRRFLSYLVGWVVLLGEIATAAGCAMNSAQITAAIIELHHPGFHAASWNTYLIYMALTILSLAFCFSQRHLPAIAVLGGVITLGGGLAWAISFLALAPKQTARFVFTEFVNNSGYHVSAWVGVMSFYTPIYALYGTDGILHIAEEMRDAPKSAPRAMVYSMVFSGITSLMGALVMAFCSGNWEAYMESDFPFLNWFVDVLDSSAGGSALVIVVIVLLNFLITVGINTAGSRLAWGMAGDHALPLSNFFAKVNQSVHTPLNALLFIITAELTIGLVLFGSDYAFQIIVSLGGVAIQFGYLIPILMLLIRGRSALPTDRQFKLNSFGYIVNVAAVCWSSLVIIILFFPLYVPITANNLVDMNWAVVIFAGLVVFIIVDWMFRGRHHYVISDE
ncbi:hypothetical protein BFJ68_g7365 [Fusarium oxysporum]|uniref:Choline transport protein n=1 Tax=Fusarium oxysporum TaxID=5507 RepID=A0A420R7J3_FUSOX|nr:hypothetical protein BFJ68_g7365 [Fusarium oxysporum]